MLGGRDNEPRAGLAQLVADLLVPQRGVDRYEHGARERAGALHHDPVGAVGRPQGDPVPRCHHTEQAGRHGGGTIHQLGVGHGGNTMIILPA